MWMNLCVKMNQRLSGFSPGVSDPSLWTTAPLLWHRRLPLLLGKKSTPFAQQNRFVPNRLQRQDRSAPLCCVRFLPLKAITVSVWWRELPHGCGFPLFTFSCLSLSLSLPHTHSFKESLLFYLLLLARHSGSPRNLKRHSGLRARAREREASRSVCRQQSPPCLTHINIPVSPSHE